MAVEVGEARRQAALARVAAVDGVRRAFMVTRDGLPVSQAGTTSQRDEVEAAVVAALCGAAQRVFGGLGLGDPRESIVHSDTHTLYCLARDDVLVVAIAERRAPGAAVRLELRRAADILVAG